MADTDIHIGVDQRGFNEGGGDVVDGYAYGTEQDPDGSPRNHCHWRAYRSTPESGWTVKIKCDHEPIEDVFLEELERRLKQSYPSSI